LPVRKLPFETNNEKFSLRRVKRKKIRGHRGEVCCRAVWRWAILESKYEDGMRKKLSIICVKVVV